MQDVVLHLGDCAQVMAEHIADNSIDLTVTSPPYDNLRTYNGYTFDFEAIASQLWRVTKPGGVVVWVVGDATINGSETGTSFRQALRFMELGFNLHDTMIYQKVAGATGSNLAYWQVFEFMFVLSKGTPNAISLIADRRNAKKPGRIREVAGHRYPNGDKKGLRDWERELTGIRFNIWQFDAANGIDRSLEHPAQFPEALARDHILSWSNPGDVVLDPMMGSGTTGKMALLTGRRFVGIDISAEYVELARQRIAKIEAQPFLFHPAETQEQAQQLPLDTAHQS